MSRRFNNLNRKHFYLNESNTALRLIQILTYSHLVLQNSTDQLSNRSLPNTFAKSIATLLLNFLATHSALPADRLAHSYRELVASIVASTSATSTSRKAPTSTPPSADHKPEAVPVTTGIEPSTDTSSLSLSLVTSEPPPTDSSGPEGQDQRSQVECQVTRTIQSATAAMTSAPSTTAPTTLSKFSCQTCNVPFPSITMYRAHLRSPEHQQRLRGRSATGAAQPAQRSAQPGPEAQPEETITNPASQALKTHAPSVISFAQSTNDDEPERKSRGTKGAAQAQPQPQPQPQTLVVETEIGYHQSTHESGVLDFHYRSVDDDDERFLSSLPLPSANTRRGQRPSSSQRNKDRKDHSPNSSRSRSRNNSSNSDFASDSAQSESDYASEYEDDVGDAKSGAISNKAGTEVLFCSYPTDPKPADPRATTPNPHQPYNITTTRHHHPQNVVLMSPHLGLLLVPTAAAQLSNLALSRDDEHESDYGSGVNSSTAATTTTTATSKRKSKSSPIAASYNPIIQAAFMHFFRLVAQTMPYNASSVLPPLTAIIMDSGGKFALSLFLGNVIVYHTSFANYTTRKKQGKAQSSHDRAGGGANTAGSMIRRQQTDRHRERIREILYHLRGELACCQQILLYVPSILMREQMFLSKAQQVAWAQSGGCWIGQSSSGRSGPSAMQRALETEAAQQSFNKSPNDFVGDQVDGLDSIDYSELVPAEFVNQFSQQSAHFGSEDDDDDDGASAYADPYPVSPVSPNVPHPTVAATATATATATAAISSPVSPHKPINFSPNHALLSTHRDDYQGTVQEPYPVSSVPLTTPLAIPNLFYYFNIKYSSALTQLASAHRSTIDKATGDYQMLYFHRLNKKNAKRDKMLSVINAKNAQIDDDDDDLDHKDHSITAEWHKDTLMYHYNNTIDTEAGTDGQSNFGSGISLSPSPNAAVSSSSSTTKPKRVLYVDQFLPNSPLGGFNLNPQSFQADMTGTTQPPKFTGPLQLPATAQQQIKMKNAFHSETDSQRHPTSSYRLSSFLDPTVLATVAPSIYTVQPYHPHMIKANHTTQHEHLWLLHPADPRISTLGLTVHDAKHNEIVRVYQHLMMCKIKPLSLGGTDGADQ